jgi:hypothetical protein
LDGSSLLVWQDYDPRDTLRIVFGEETARNEAFVADVSNALAMIVEKGVVYALLHTV